MIFVAVLPEDREWKFRMNRPCSKLNLPVAACIESDPSPSKKIVEDLEWKFLMNRPFSKLKLPVAAFVVEAAPPPEQGAGDRRAGADSP